MATYEFLTRFAVRAPREAVYGLIIEPERWLGSWGDLVEARRLRDATPDGDGGCLEGSVRAPFGYRIGGQVETVEVDPPSFVRMQIRGVIVGGGTWTLEERAGVTRTELVWAVDPVAAWLRALTPVARPLFEAGHARVVRHAVETAAATLDAELVSFDSGTRSRRTRSSGPPVRGR